MKRPMTRILLSVSGVLLFVVGAATLFQPHAFFASNGAMLGNEPSLLSEVRAPGGLLIGCASVMLLGVFRQSIIQQALILAVMVYGSFGVSRLVGITLDGLPSASLIGATALELIVGALCILALTRLKSNQSIVAQH
jgi:hypothetical protein